MTFSSISRLSRVFVAVVAVSAGFWWATAFADQEGALVLSAIELTSPGLEGSGPVRVSGSQSTRGVSDLTISAFGKTRVLSAAELKLLDGMPFNSVALSYSNGYANSGGRSIYVLLSQSFSSGSTLIAVIGVTERGDVRIVDKRPNSNQH